MILKEANRAQLTVFIIIAIILVAGVALFFAFRSGLSFGGLPANIQPVYNTFTSCIEEDALVGIDVLESQAGYIELPDFEPGSSYMPFSNQLDFLGNGIPYWYYVSGNNIQKTQVPSESDMEEQLANFIEGQIENCIFDAYYEQGFEIVYNPGDARANVEISDNGVDIILDMDLEISQGEETALVRNHNINVNSKLGTLYNSAKEIYEYEQETLFLENYAVDNLRLYAPVDGVEITCSPKIWNANDVFSELQQGIEANTLAIKLRSNTFSLRNEENEYFVQDLNVEGDVRFINSQNWSYAFEVNPSEGNVLISNPVGNQPGLGILGFCYVPYHFVYDVKYPVLVQITEAEETFQFPMAVVVQGNKQREPLEGADAFETEIFNFCENKNTEIQVNVFDTSLNPVDANISYECSGTVCQIGETSFGSLQENFPQCVNGDIIVNAEGYNDARYQFSSVSQGIIDVVVDKVYEMNVDLKLGGQEYNGMATISFISEEGESSTIVYPDQKTVELSEGQYEVQVYTFRNASITLGATSEDYCTDVPQEGIGGFFGFTKEKCYTIDVPSQVVSSALAGGGKQNYYVLESELKNANAIELDAEKLPVPTSVEELQNNYLLFEEKGLTINFI